MRHEEEISQLRTQIAILESQLNVKEVALGGLNQEVKRLTELVESLLKGKEQWKVSYLQYYLHS